MFDFLQGFRRVNSGLHTCKANLYQLSHLSDLLIYFVKVFTEPKENDSSTVTEHFLKQAVCWASTVRSTRLRICNERDSLQTQGALSSIWKNYRHSNMQQITKYKQLDCNKWAGKPEMPGRVQTKNMPTALTWKSTFKQTESGEQITESV